MSTFTVRPSNSEKEAFRVKLTAVSLLSLKLRSGDLCSLDLPSAYQDGSTKIAIAWEQSGTGMKDNIVQTSRFLQDFYGLKLGDKVTISRVAAKLEDADVLSLRPVGFALPSDEHAKWTLLASMALHRKYDTMAPKQKVLVEMGDEKAEFEVHGLSSHLMRITKDTRFTIETDSHRNDTGVTRILDGVDFSKLGGLELQLSKVKRVVRHINQPRIADVYAAWAPHQGLLLYGSKGTGKSAVIDRLATGRWSNVMEWTPGTKIMVMPGQLIKVDLSEGSPASKNPLELLRVFEMIKGTPSLVIAECRHPNDINQRLRSPEFFSVELELPIPDASQRYEILRSLRGDGGNPGDIVLREIALKTHGFVGGDLKQLLREAWMNTADRLHDLRLRNQTEQMNGLATDPTESDAVAPLQTERDPTAEDFRLSNIDIEYALSQIRPSALQEIFLEKPNVHWSDIGGQNELKRALHNAVERPLRHRAQMAALGIDPKKGVLLYGPPGCSKTLMVKALATEANLNFLAVKGAELISMYVGESEKATREVFRKARQAAPSIIFFDEIDAIASRKKSGGDLNVLTTLLNEMDGFEELRGVFVVAATNKPESIDPALLRPGRFDSVIYVGPPDHYTRKEIFDKRFDKINAEDAVKANTAQYAAATDGFSGAEVVAVCQAAGESALDNDRDQITEGDVLQAISRQPKSITKKILDDFESWNKSRM